MMMPCSSFKNSMPYLYALNLKNSKLKFLRYLIIAQTYFTYVVHTATTFAYIRLLNKPYANEVTLTEQKIPLNCCQPFDFLYTFKSFRSFIAVIMKSKGFKVTAVKI